MAASIARQLIQESSQRNFDFELPCLPLPTGLSPLMFPHSLNLVRLDVVIEPIDLVNDDDCMLVLECMEHGTGT